jgi:6-phosphogluconolactonase
MTAHRLTALVLTLAMFGAALAALTPCALAGDKQPDKLWVFVGTYTDGKSKGIYRCELEVKTGKLTNPQVAAELRSPSFLAIHPSHRFLYAVNESGSGKNTGAVSALALDPASGTLKFLNDQPSGGDGPCHINVDKTGKNALIANYGGGSAAVLPIGADGKLAPISSFVQHKGSSVDKSRQEAPHAHSVNLDKANRFAFVCDLGLDKVMIYRFDADKGTITPNGPAYLMLDPGSGPRHFAFHPDGKSAYVNGEMAMTITACDYDAAKGALTKRQTLSTLPPGADRKGASTAETVVHPSGKFVYVSNRGHNTIAIFTIDPATRKLTAAGHQGENIKTPRNFAIDPTGTYLIVANQDGHSLVVFRINQETGALEPTGNMVDVPNPVCVRMVAVGA